MDHVGNPALTNQKGAGAVIAGGGVDHPGIHDGKGSGHLKDP